jgi:hypothetical protein
VHAHRRGSNGSPTGWCAHTRRVELPFIGAGETEGACECCLEGREELGGHGSRGAQHVASGRHGGRSGWAWRARVCGGSASPGCSGRMSHMMASVSGVRRSGRRRGPRMPRCRVAARARCTGARALWHRCPEFKFELPTFERLKL